MLIKKDSAQKKSNSLSCIVWEYEFSSRDLGLAKAQIHGRYPENGKAVNSECDMIYYVLSGRGIIHYDNEHYEVTEGDAFFFEKKKEYWIEGQNLVVIVSNAPTWYPAQYRYVE